MTTQDVDERLLRMLRDPLLWDAPAFGGWDTIREVMEKVQAEDDAAAALCDAILAAPAVRWAQRLGKTPGARTAGMVRELLRRMPAMLARKRADALKATSLALAIGEALDPQDYWPDHVMQVRAQALREHAQVLSFLGRCTEAMGFVDRSERAFAQVSATTFDLARLALVKASVLRKLNRAEEAAALAHDAATKFLHIGDRKRHLDARMTEAELLSESGAVERALEVWRSLEGDPALDARGALRVAQGSAMCLRHSNVA